MNGEAVVLVHGLWMSGWAMALLARRLRRRGYQTYCFCYPSMHRALDANAAALQDFVRSVPGERVHLVGHSLGGLVIRKSLSERQPNPRIGRVVSLGSPLRGSHVAGWALRHRFTRVLLGRAAPCLLEGLPEWRGMYPHGVIAGDLPIGVGRLVPDLPRPHDGSVTVAETRVSDAVDHITLPVSHFGLLLSKRAARQVAQFLRTGAFSR